MNPKVSGFTIVETLITLALTSVFIALTYTAFSKLQFLFWHEEKQNQFVKKFIGLQMMINREAQYAEYILYEEPCKIVFHKDSNSTVLSLTQNKFIVTKGTHSDTISMDAELPEVEFQPIDNLKWDRKLIRFFSCDINFSNVAFNIQFKKDIEPSARYRLEVEQ